MFCHCHMLLLPQVRRIVQHCDRTRRGKSTLQSLWLFRFLTCIFSFGTHNVFRSRTVGTTSIPGLNHGWNRPIVSKDASALPFLLLFLSSPTFCSDNKQNSHKYSECIPHTQPCINRENQLVTLGSEEKMPYCALFCATRKVLLRICLRNKQISLTIPS